MIYERQKTRPLNDGSFLLYILRPDKVGVDGFTAVDNDALTGAEGILYSQEICSAGNFISSSPTFQRGLIHYLLS